MKKIKRFFLKVRDYVAKDHESEMKNEIRWTLEKHPHVKKVRIEKIYSVVTYLDVIVAPDEEIDEEIYKLELDLIKLFPGATLDFSFHM